MWDRRTGRAQGCFVGGFQIFRQAHQIGQHAGLDLPLLRLCKLGIGAVAGVGCDGVVQALPLVLPAVVGAGGERGAAANPYTVASSPTRSGAS